MIHSLSSTNLCRPTPSRRRSAPSTGERVMTEAIALLFSSASFDYTKSHPGFLTPAPEEFFGSAKAIEVAIRAPHAVRRVGFLKAESSSATSPEKQQFQKFLAFLQPIVEKSVPFSIAQAQAQQYLGIAIKALSIYCVFLDYEEDMYRTHVVEPLRWFVQLLFPKGIYEKIGAKLFRYTFTMIDELQSTCSSHKHIGDLLHNYERLERGVESEGRIF